MTTPELASHKDVAEWWGRNPMTYGEGLHGGTNYRTKGGETEVVERGSARFFELADRRFYEWNADLHTSQAPFGRLFDYDRFRDKSVLEVGCGMGYMASNWARQGARMTAVDLSSTGVEQTRRRFELSGLPGRILRMDGSQLALSDNTFDYAYSWGVLHHFPATQQAIDEIWRVLKPGAPIGVMLYYRRSFRHLYKTAYLEGFLHCERQFLSPLQLASRYGDGAREEGNPHTWPVTQRESHEVLFRRFEDIQTTILPGENALRVIDSWLPKFGTRMLPGFLAAPFIRRFGWSLWITARKPLSAAPR